MRRRRRTHSNHAHEERLERMRVLRRRASTAFLIVVVTAAGLFGALKVSMVVMSIAAERAMKERPEPFPIGVDPIAKSITEDPNVETYFSEIVASNGSGPSRRTWAGRILRKLTRQDWYQNVAAIVGKTVVIWPGDRHEEVVDSFGDILRWSDGERAAFAAAVINTEPVFTEGKFYPGLYQSNSEATPLELAEAVNARFSAQVLDRYTDEIAEKVPLEDALIIASLLEREAYDFDDMRHISGIIWNRLFIGEKLQIDSTLQYIKGSRPHSPWWPGVAPSDKYLKSPFNTYEHHGLPPSPIANPSLDAILATLNPIATDCIFYFHDANGGFHCSPTYEGHVELLKQYYGQGR